MTVDQRKEMAGRFWRYNVQFQYDSLGQFTSEIKSSTNNPYQITYEYCPSGNRTRMVKNSFEHIYSYNNANQLAADNAAGPSALPIAVTGTTTDENGIKSVIVNDTNAVLDGNNFSCLITLSPGVNTITVSAADNADNTTTQTVHVTYNQADQTLYLYDNNGNLIKKQSSTQTLDLNYGYENRLNSITGTGVNVSYAYNGEGKRVYANNNSNITNYLYDGLDIVLEKNSSNDSVVSYLRNPSAAGGIGGIIHSQQGLNLENYYSYDGLGSVANLSDVAGVNIQSYQYDAFGNLFYPPVISNAHQFLTKEIDSSGFVYFGARYYDPAIGRFITQDPLGMVDGPNMYVYARNDPVDLVDLWGLCGDKKWAPFWVEIIVPGYRNYGGPSRVGPGKPEDIMDAMFQRHDIGYSQGDRYKADVVLIIELSSLPVNPYKWGKGINPVYAILYRAGANTFFSTKILIRDIGKALF